MFMLVASTSLFLACEPEYSFGGDDNGGDNKAEEPIPVPKPEEPENPNPEPEPDPTPDPTPVEITATLTYSECADVIGGYGSPANYRNSYGTWVVCAYDFGSAIQINKNKVAYIGTPTFEGDIKKISLKFVESYSGDIYLCSEAGSTSVAGQFESPKRRTTLLR